MISQYVNAALQRVQYKRLPDETWFAEIPGFDGVWASAENQEACKAELVEVLEDWILLKVQDHDPLPDVGVDIQPRRVSVG